MELPWQLGLTHSRKCGITLMVWLAHKNTYFLVDSYNLKVMIYCSRFNFALQENCYNRIAAKHFVCWYCLHPAFLAIYIQNMHGSYARMHLMPSPAHGLVLYGNKMWLFSIMKLGLRRITSTI